MGECDARRGSGVGVFEGVNPTKPLLHEADGAGSVQCDFDLVFERDDVPRQQNSLARQLAQVRELAEATRVYQTDDGTLVVAGEIERNAGVACGGINLGDGADEVRVLIQLRACRLDIGCGNSAFHGWAIGRNGLKRAFVRELASRGPIGWRGAPFGPDDPAVEKVGGALGMARANCQNASDGGKRKGAEKYRRQFA